MKTILGTMTFSDQVGKNTAATMLSMFANTSNVEIDTAFVYNKGKTETLLGELNKQGQMQGLAIAGKANPWQEGGLTPASVRRQLETSLSRLNTQRLDLFYLHAPDLGTPILETLQAVAQLYAEGKFDRFGLSNYAAWQVAEIVELCNQNGWLAPTVYQGMYNAITRDVERELFPCLKNYHIAFNAYNPLAGGLLSGKHQDINAMPNDGRFATFNGYADRYWKPSYFQAINTISETCKRNNILPAEAALRWLKHHSSLETTDWTQHGVIIGASSIEHLEMNLAALNAPALPPAVLAVFDEAWGIVRPACIKYFRP